MKIEDISQNVRLLGWNLKNAQQGDAAKPEQNYHYTSMRNLFNILESDSLWITNPRFSNDGSERPGDHFVVCFCNDGDELSQWRGYCPNGGASIQFSIGAPMSFSVLHKDFSTSYRYELYENMAIPVCYIKFEEGEIARCKQAMEEVCPPGSINENLWAYIKNEDFRSENESRLVFPTAGSLLTPCIRYRELENGRRVPYMIIRAGDIGSSYKSCNFDEDSIKKMIKKLRTERSHVLVLPDGSNQETLYNRARVIVKENNDAEPRKAKIRLICEGHLPIQRITIAPGYNREILKEEVEWFCKTKYWLQDVEVTTSKIPYIPPSE